MRKSALYIFIVAAIILGIIGGLAGCNATIIDTKWKAEYAWIDIPGRGIVEGPVSSWTDYEDGDQLQLTINGETFLTSTERCVVRFK